MASPRFRGWLLLLFAGSGCAALVYEVIWFQLLELVLGATALSIGLLLATFMGGMCLGSFLLARVVPPTRHPLRLYAQLEVGIAIFAIVILLAVPTLRGPSVVLLLPPTVLMGATLPAIARWIESSPEGVSWLGFLYGGNIGGAVFGSLLAGFYLLRLYDMAHATYVAAAINVAVAGLAWVLATRVPHAVKDARAADGRGAKARPAGERVTCSANLYRSRVPIYAAIALSGLAPPGAEVVWTRILSLLFGGTVYTFSLIAAAFLFGLGIGSAVGAWLARDSARPGAMLAACPVGVAVSVAWGAALITRAHPYWPLDPALAAGPWVNFQIDLLRACIAVVPW